MYPLNTMPVFQKKTIAPAERICLRLKGVRKAKRISLAELERLTKISRAHLRALEECRFADLPGGGVYQKNFIKKYVAALEVDPAPFLAQFIEEELRYKKEKTPHPTRAYRHTNFSNLPQALRYAFVFLVVVGVSLYLGGQIRETLEPPKLTVTSPVNGYTTHENRVVITGFTDKEVEVSINGTRIVSDEKGTFAEDIALTPGINSITVEAIKKHGKKTAETRHVIMKERDGSLLSWEG